MNVAALLEKNAKEYPERPAFIFKEREITFGELRGAAFSLADSLRGLSLKKQDKIAIYLPNSPEYVLGYLASWCLGAVCVPLDFMLTQDELISCISHSEARILIARGKPNISFAVIKERCPALEKVIICGEGIEPLLSFDNLLKEGRDIPPQADINDKDYAVIFYTSGTTGKPKGVLANYLQLCAPPKAIKYFVNNDIYDKDTVICPLPLSHIGGLISVQANLAFSVSVVLMGRFIPLEFLRNIEKYKINWFWLVPSMYYALLQSKEFDAFDLSSLRWINLFGAPSSIETIRRFHQRCPSTIFYHGWGLTETNAPTTVIPTGSDKLESVGKPAPWIQIKIFDERDNELSCGQTGEIAVRGWVVTDGYYKDAELTKDTMRNGWFHTGDLGRFDEEGDLYISGRKKEMIKVAGEIVFEPEVETAIHKHPDITEVAVIGVADKLRGEVPKAFVALKEGAALDEEALRYFCRQHLAHFKVPHYFEFVDSLPKNRAGKIDKNKIREGR
ncbi:MAG: AMP-binding protein [Candidatus Omnitrophota bacterium]|jgi:acyl-CoA synthetase (AMP-forming)/AMP-acid ligase II